MPWFVRNLLLLAQTPGRINGLRGVRGVGRARKRDVEAAELWDQMGEDELLSNDPGVLRIHREEVAKEKLSRTPNAHVKSYIVTNQEKRAYRENIIGTYNFNDLESIYGQS